MGEQIGDWYQAISQFGLPILFVYGLKQRWWVMRSESDLMAEQMDEMRKQMAQQREQLERAAQIHETNYEIITSLREQLARLVALQEARLKEGSSLS